MNLKNKFCRSVDPSTLTPPLTKIPGSAPGYRDITMLDNHIVKNSIMLHNPQTSNADPLN